jgi:hypothetical protein
MNKIIIIETEEDSIYDIKSGDNIYQVKYSGNDINYSSSWLCNCPAYRYGHGGYRSYCKHINAVINYLDSLV